MRGWFVFVPVRQVQTLQTGLHSVLVIISNLQHQQSQVEEVVVEEVMEEGGGDRIEDTHHVHVRVEPPLYTEC